MRVIDPADFLFENEVLERWPMLTKAELRRARRANPPRIEFYSFERKSGGPRYTPEQVQSYIDRTYLRISECPQLDSRAPHQALSSSGDSELGGYYLERPHPEHLGFWYACRYDPGTRQVRRRSLKTTDFEEAKVRFAALVASAPAQREPGRTTRTRPDPQCGRAQAHISTNAGHTLHQRVRPSGRWSCSRTILPA